MRVHGLASQPELNGSVGEVEGPALDERVFVRLDAPHNKTVSLKSSNLEELGSSDGRWRVRLERLGGDEAPKECKVSAAAIGALPNWPFLGVSVACLRAFARAHEALLVDATTEDVCERVCKPLTETAGDSLAACLVRLGAVDPATGVPLAAAPTIFVSHAPNPSPNPAFRGWRSSATPRTAAWLPLERLVEGHTAPCVLRYHIGARRW